MRYALFTDKAEADAFAAEIESLCTARNVKGLNGSKIIKYASWIGWISRWAVKMNTEPDVLPAVIVDSVEQPVIEE